MRTSERLIKAFAKLNEDIMEYAAESGERLATLYENASTTRMVGNFHLHKNGVLEWDEEDLVYDRVTGSHLYRVHKERYSHIDEDDVRDTLRFWRDCLRKAKRYDSYDAELLEALQDGEVEDND